MYKHFSRPKKRSSSYVAIVSVAGLAYGAMMALSPQKTESIDSRVFVEGVTIHMSHNAPPVAALEDILMEKDFGDDQIPASVPKIALISGLSSMKEIAEKIMSDNEAIHKNEVQDIYVPVAQMVHPAHVQNIDLKSVGVTREELLNALFIPMINHDPAIINRGGQNQRQPSVSVASNETVIVPHRNKDVAPTTALLAAHVSGESFIQNSDPSRQVTINGALEMNQGLAFTSPKDRIVVYREDKGQAFENGVVWTKEGRFEINVGSTSGLLVAELRTQTGEILGSGRATMDAAKILIRLTPTTQGLVGRVVAANSSDIFEAKPLKSTKLMVDMIPHEFISEAGGRFSDPNLVNQSTMILKSQRTGFLPGITVASAGDDNLIPMYSKKMVTELLSLQPNADKINNPEGEATAPLDMKNLAIVWGRITKNGEAVTGGQVEILSVDQNLKPVYFNKMMIPDLSLSETSSNGYYAFVGVNPGVQSLQVTYASHLTEPSVVPADANSISQLNIDVLKSKEANIMVFDGFHTEKSLPAAIMNLGQNSGVETDERGQTTLKYADGTGLMILDVDAGQDYELTRLTLNRSRNTIYAPLVKQAWFEELRKQAGLDVIAHTGSIMGFIQSDRPYKAAFGEAVSDTTKIVYFNSRGEMIKGDVGEAGGGFVVFNAPEGLLTVSVLLLDSEKILTQTTYVDRSVVSTFSHWFH